VVSSSVETIARLIITSLGCRRQTKVEVRDTNTSSEPKFKATKAGIAPQVAEE
jgi:hypothetical protein